MAAEIRGKVVVDTNDLSRAGVAADNFEKKLSGVFRRSPHMRAERALEGFARNLTAGDIPGAIDSIAGKLTGIGLAAGVGFGVASAFIVKTVKDTNELSKAMDKINSTMGKGVLGGGSAEQAKAGFGESLKLLEDFEKKRRSTFAGIGTFFGGGQSAVTEDSKYAANISRGRSQQRQVEITSVQQIVTQLNNEAAAEERVASLASAKLSVTSSEVAMRKIGMEYDIKIAKLLEEQVERRAQIQALKLSPENEQAAMSALSQNLRGRIDAAKEEKEASEEQAKRDRAKPFFEKTQLTMQELLAVDPRAQGLLREPARLARLAQSEEQASERSRKIGDVAEAARHAFIAGQIRNQIGVLSDKEKMPELAFKNALESAQIFQSILQELMRVTNGVNNISFTNK